MIDLNSLNIKTTQKITNESEVTAYALDWTKFFTPKACGLVFPESTEDVVTIVQWARLNKVSLVPSGGRTGLSGGAVAHQGELIVSFERMNKIFDFNRFDRVVRVQPGVITEALQEFAVENDLYFPVDFAAKGSSHIAGNIATNAGGVKVVRYGLTRDWVIGLTVVTGTGEVLELNHSLIKNATGYDLRHLFIGSEGTLGFITEAEIKLTNPPPTLSTMVFGLTSLDHMMDVFALFRKELTLTAFEMFSDLALKKVLAHHSLQSPFETPAPYNILIEAENPNEEKSEQILSLFETCLENGWLIDGVVSQSQQQSKELWALREYISESLAPLTPYKNDISVRPSKITDFIKELDSLLTKQYPDFEVVWFGHVGDGNLHINILKPSGLTREEFFKKAQEVDRVLFEKILEYKGSISAEHGVGLIKKPYLNYTRSESEIRILKKIKSIFDPDGIINPGKMID